MSIGRSAIVLQGSKLWIGAEDVVTRSARQREAGVGLNQTEVGSGGSGPGVAQIVGGATAGIARDNSVLQGERVADVIADTATGSTRGVIDNRAVGDCRRAVVENSTAEVASSNLIAGDRAVDNRQRAAVVINAAAGTGAV